MVTIKLCELNHKLELSSTNIWQHWQNHKDPKIVTGNFTITLMDRQIKWTNNLANIDSM